MIILFYFTELFQLGKSFISNAWHLDQGDGKQKKPEAAVISQKSSTSNGSENIGDSSTDDDDASSSVTVTSPQVTDNPSTDSSKQCKPPIGISLGILFVFSPPWRKTLWDLGRGGGKSLLIPYSSLKYFMISLF